MSKEQIMEWFYTNNASLSAVKILVVMLFALLIASIICMAYKFTYRGVSYNSQFNISLALTLLITVVIMLMISSNIVISLGMVGALSIVRFRTAIKDPHDTIYIFWAIVEGLSVGSQNFKLAIITTLFIAIISYVAQRKFNIWHKSLLILRTNEAFEPEQLNQLLDKNHIRSRLKTFKLTNGTGEYIYELSIRKKELNDDFISMIHSLKNVITVNVLLETSDTIS